MRCEFVAVRRKKPTGLARVLDQAGRDPNKGSVYWFLWDAHDGILERTEGRQIPWRTLLTEIQDLDLTNSEGKPVTNVESLRKTFARVRAAKEREENVRQQKAAAPKRPTNQAPPVAARPIFQASTTGAKPLPIGMDFLEAEILKASGKRVR